MSGYGDSRTISIVLGEHVSNYYMSPFVRGALQATAEFGCRLLLYTTLNTRLSRYLLEPNDLPLLTSHRDAYLLPGNCSPAVFAACRAQGALVLGYNGAVEGYPSLGPDNYAAARAATLHLINQGRRQIVHLAGLGHSQEALERLRGYRDALHESGIAYDQRLVRNAFFGNLEGMMAVQELLSERIAFDAIFAANDMSAIGAYRALQNAQLRIPEDVAIVGFDDIAAASALSPPLSSVRQSVFQIGWEAIRLLVEARDQADLPAYTALPSQLILRESCGSATKQEQTNDPFSRFAQQASREGKLLNAIQAKTVLQAVTEAIHHNHRVEAEIDTLLTRCKRSGWDTSAVFDYLDWLWHNPRSDVPQHYQAALWQAIKYANHKQALTSKAEQLQRSDRINTINYTIDLLRESNAHQSLDAVLRYMSSNGFAISFSALYDPESRLINAQGFRVQGPNEEWQGPLERFPPLNWIKKGEACMIQPLTNDAQSLMLFGIVEAEGQAHLDLDDLLLRSVNTYRSISVLNQTLQELEAARSVQLSLLPRHAPRSDEYEIVGSTRTARRVGGDLYGYYQRPSGNLAIALGDVAGKGMPAALLMSACATALAGTIQAGLAPSLTLSQIHQILQPSVGRQQNAALCLVYLEDSYIRIANAGAISPFIRRKHELSMLDIGGLPLGTPLGDLLSYRELSEELEVGDLLILCSDGIIEAMNETKEIYGFERFEASIRSGPNQTAQAMHDHIFREVDRFVDKAEMHDDMALIVARYKGKHAIIQRG
jgi:DNA-binding LacI/PurR family transcriptional regulator/serine/threonine protein phosphatase PrpC